MDPGAELQRAGFGDVRLIGEGSFGQVYRATDGLGRDVAIKIVDIRSSADSDIISSEVHAAASIAPHPHIMDILGWGLLSEDRAYLAMPLADGSLQDYSVPIDQKTLLEVAIQIGSALAAAHDIGIVHRDVKPSNILRRGSNFFYLADFGISMRVESEANAFFTPIYSAPEQVVGGAVATASDIYSLAATLARLAGVSPGRGIEDTVLQPQVLSNLTWARQGLADIKMPEGLRELLGAALDADPLRRPTAKDFVQRVENIRDAERGVVRRRESESNAARPGRSSSSDIDASVDGSIKPGGLIGDGLISGWSTVDRGILAQSVSAPPQVVLKSARKAESVREQRQFRWFGGAVVAASTGVAGASAVVEATSVSANMRSTAWGSVLVLAFAVPLILLGARFLIGWARARRRNELLDGALELSARMRNAYGKEIESLRSSFTVVPRTSARGASASKGGL